MRRKVCSQLFEKGLYRESFLSGLEMNPFVTDGLYPSVFTMRTAARVISTGHGNEAMCHNWPKDGRAKHKVSGRARMLRGDRDPRQKREVLEIRISE
jgi:hypothetical protein